MKLLQRLALIVLLLCAPQAGAAEADDITPAHRDALTRLLTGFRVEDILNGAVRTGARAGEADPARVDRFVDDLLSASEPGELTRRLVPVYAPYLTEVEAAEGADFFATETGEKFAAAVVGEVTRQPASANLAASKRDEAALARFVATPAGKLITAPPKALREALNQAGYQWGGELAKRRMRRAFAAVVAAVQAPAQSVPAADDIVLAPTAGPFEQAAAVTLASLQRMRALQAKMHDDLHAVGMQGLLSPESLSSASRIVESKRALEKARAVVESYLSAAPESMTRFTQQLESVSFPAKYKGEYLRGIKDALEPPYTRFIRFAENQQQLLQLFERMLDFAQSRQEGITLVDGKLRFRDQGDVDTYTAIATQIDAEVKRERELVKESQDAQQKALQLLR